MTISELKYMIALEEIGASKGTVKQSELAKRLGVSKPSVFKAIERLQEKGYVTKNGVNVSVSEKGSVCLYENMKVVKFMETHLREKCNIDGSIAYTDALNAVCAFSEETISNLKKYIDSREKQAP